MSICFIDTSYRFGYHCGKRESMLSTVKSALNPNSIISALQVYISSPRSKKMGKIDTVDLRATRRFLEDYQEVYMCIHGCLLYNLAGNVTGENYEQSLSETVAGLVAELDFGVALGVPSGAGVGIVIHPGSRKDRSAGHAKVSETLNIVLRKVSRETKHVAESMGLSVEDVVSRRKVILENSAGEGTKLCATLEEIAEVIDGVDEELRGNVKVCIDTAHSFGRGIYDWGVPSEVDRFYNDFDEIVGLEFLEVFHLNDSKVEFKSRKDRHENLGCGFIFENRLDGLKQFITKAKEHGIPMICESPTDGEYDVVTAARLMKNEMLCLNDE